MAYGSKSIRGLFEASPPLIRDLMATGYGIRHRGRKYGAYFRRHLEALTVSQWWSSAQHERAQAERLQRFVQRAVAAVPYYRQLFAEHELRSEEIQSAGDLRRLPLLEKETVRALGRGLMPAGWDRRQVVWFHTSGTTGKALEVPISQECFEREYAFRWLHYSWAGIDRHERIATLAGHPVAPVERLEPPFWVTNRAENQLLLSSQHLTSESMAHYAAKLRDWQPAMIHGYPSSLYLLALGLTERDEREIRPRAVFTASETLMDHQRAAIEAAFDCKVYNWYGNTEMTGNIVDCDLGSLHVKPEHSLLEFLNAEGEPARPGELAEIIATGYGNEAYPLLRYRTGDTAILSDRPCECGRGGPIVRRVTGRVEDIVVTPDGRHVGRLDHVFKDSPNVREAQIIQETPDTLVVRIVRRAEYSARDTERVNCSLRERVGERMRFQLEFVEWIPRGANGKFRFVVSKVGVRLGGQQAQAAARELEGASLSLTTGV
jgi:phenylacetate-CoA ligase